VTLLKPVSLAFAAASLIGIATLAPAQAQMTPNPQVITNGPQSSGVEQSGTWSPRQNVVNSQRYTRLVETNPAFRANRMRKECGPITDPQLHAQCVASFSQDNGG
jgi:hypothetical protein